jgi:hypothetical protein
MAERLKSDKKFRNSNEAICYKSVNNDTPC